MTEQEAFKAMVNGSPVILKRLEKVYQGHLIAKHEPAFVFKGNRGTEEIQYRGYPRDFSLVED